MRLPRGICPGAKGVLAATAVVVVCVGSLGSDCCLATYSRATSQAFALSSHWRTLEALIGAFCPLDKSLSCCWKKGWMVGAVGIELLVYWKQRSFAVQPGLLSN